MYRYDKENQLYIFDGDLEQFLLDKGVEAEHIEKMKEKYYNLKKRNIILLIGTIKNYIKEKQDLYHCQK